MSVWDDYQGGAPVPPGTPDLRVEYEPGLDGEQPSWVVYADGGAVHRDHTGYAAVHRWMMNAYRLTSTQMLPVNEVFFAAYPATSDRPAEVAAPVPADTPNKYRKDGK